MDPKVIIRRLEELRDKIAEWETKPVETKNSTEFEVWKTEVESWLLKGGNTTGTETAYFMNLSFGAVSDEYGEPSYSMDVRQYLKDLALARVHINSAIDGLRHGFVPPEVEGQAIRRGDTHIHVTQILNNTTALNVFQSLQEKARQEPETPEKQDLLKKLGDLTRNPLFIKLAGQMLSSYLGGGS